MNSERDVIVSEVIKNIIADFGIEVFCDSRKACALVADYFSANTLAEEKALLKRVLASGAVGFFITNQNDYAASRQKALYILTEQEFIAETWAERALSWFDVALGRKANEEKEEFDFIQQLISASEEAERKNQQPSCNEFLSPIDMLLDENNTDNIVLYNGDNEKVEFEQIALIPYCEKTYAILKPALNMPGIADDEALVFVIDEVDDEDCLVIVEDDSVVDAVFEEYYKMLRAEGVDVD